MNFSRTTQDSDEFLGSRELKPRSLVTFALIVWAAGWLACIPLWMGSGIETPGFGIIAVIMMFTPAATAVLMVTVVEREDKPFKQLGLSPIGPLTSFSKYLLLALLVTPALVIVALVIGAWLGIYPADFTNFSLFRKILDSKLAEVGLQDEAPPIALVVTAQAISIVLSAFVNLVPALGEEIGWRGWLLPRLMARGRIRALIVCGLVWGLWHTPLLLLGYNYPHTPGWLAVICMSITCVLLGTYFGWLRMRSGSVWPSALAHGSFNAAAPGFMQLFQADGTTVDTTSATILGWSGWIVLVPFCVLLIMFCKWAPKPRQKRER